MQPGLPGLLEPGLQTELGKQPVWLALSLARRVQLQLGLPAGLLELPGLRKWRAGLELCFAWPVQLQPGAPALLELPGLAGELGKQPVWWLPVQLEPGLLELLDLPGLARELGKQPAGLELPVQLEPGLLGLLEQPGLGRELRKQPAGLVGREPAGKQQVWLEPGLVKLPGLQRELGKQVVWVWPWLARPVQPGLPALLELPGRELGRLWLASPVQPGLLGLLELPGRKLGKQPVWLRRARLGKQPVWLWLAWPVQPGLSGLLELPGARRELGKQAVWLGLAWPAQLRPVLLELPGV